MDILKEQILRAKELMGQKVINEQQNLSYDEFLEEILQRGQNLQKLVEVIRKGNPTEMGHWDVAEPEHALEKFKEIANFTMNLINEFKVGINEQTVEQVDTLTHHEFMGKVDEYCIKIKGKDGESGTRDDYDKFIGNKRLRNWSDTEQWVRAYCKGKTK